MKILFLHLSDLHIKTEYAASKTHIDKILDSLRMFYPFDKIILILSGDIAFSGTSKQYKVASSIITRIFRELKNKEIYYFFVEVICVPGNHDIEYENPPRTAEELNKIYGDFSYQKNLSDELKKQENFFEFSNRNNCFCNKSIFDRKIIDIEGFKIEVNMINSAVFSLMHDEDKGLHYMNQSDINTLNTPSGADFVISVMHHSPDWYIDNQKHQIETALLCKSALIFWGHEHYSQTQKSSYNNNDTAFIHAGGSLCNDSDWTKSEFEVGAFNTDTYQYTANLFKWNNDANQYERINEIPVQLPHKPSIEKPLNVTDEFRNHLFNNDHPSFSNSFQDYYVFPRIEFESYSEHKNKEFVEIDQFIEEIQKQKRVLITGASNSGKSSLLKVLFIKLTEMGKCVILCNIDTIKKKESSKIVKTNFEDIYGTNNSNYIRFQQLPPESKVLIIDDIDQINQQDFKSYISSQSEQFGLMIFSTKNVIDFDIVEKVSSALQLENFVSKYKITPFLADKRKELVQKLIVLKNKKDPSIMVDKTVETLCNSIKLQKRFISLEPEFIISFVEYYCNNIGTSLNNDSSVFSKVFEARITDALSAHKTRGITVEKLYKLLSMLAHHIHFNKKYPIPEQEIIQVVNNYNEYFDDEVSALDFLKTIKDAKIIISDSDGYKFANRNQLSYFCAKEVNFLYNETGKEDDLKYLIQYCCFGINSDILMFISYITDNTRILNLLLDMTKEMTNDWKEFDFENNCPEFLKFTVEQKVSPPLQNSKHEKEQEELEQEKKSRDKLQTIDIYDYKEKDVDKTINQIIRTLSLMAIIAKCLPGFEHNMNAEMRKDFVKEIYTLPNKIYKMWTQEIDSIYKELIEYLKEHEQADYQNQVSKGIDKVENKVKLVSALLLLDIYSISVNYSTRDNSFRILDEKFEWRNSMTYEIQHLMMLEHQKMSKSFVDMAISLYRNCNKHLPKFLISNVVKHAYINLDKLSNSNSDRLKSVFFPVGRAEEKQALPEQKALLIKRSKNIKKENNKF